MVTRKEMAHKSVWSVGFVPSPVPALGSTAPTSSLIRYPVGEAEHQHAITSEQAEQAGACVCACVLGVEGGKGQGR